ncbi:hypothetical protein ABIB57_004637 [Devosia sp. UYZn731]|uniref:hypothetical protein n=1 Tax=Devosia sp. UYZn731 TaxID=3156345 RepID=UPI0033971772
MSRRPPLQLPPLSTLIGAKRFDPRARVGPAPQICLPTRKSTASSIFANNQPSARAVKSPTETVEKMLGNLRALGKRHQQLRVASRATLHSTLAAVCACASRLSADEKLFEAFARAQFWIDNPKQSPKHKDRANCLKFLLRWHCGVGTAASKRASRHFLQLRELGDLGPYAKVWRRAIERAGGISRMKPTRRLKSEPRSQSKKPVLEASLPWDDDDEQEAVLMQPEAYNSPPNGDVYIPTCCPEEVRAELARTPQKRIRGGRFEMISLGNRIVTRIICLD